MFDIVFILCNVADPRRVLSLTALAGTSGSPLGCKGHLASAVAPALNRPCLKAEQNFGVRQICGKPGLTLDLNKWMKQPETAAGPGLTGARTMGPSVRELHVKCRRIISAASERPMTNSHSEETFAWYSFRSSVVPSR